MRPLKIVHQRPGKIALYWYTDLNFGKLNGAVYWALKSANIWFWICVCLGFGSRYLRFTNQFIQYANKAVYPFYILHQTITVAAVYYIADWPLGIVPKFILVAIVTFCGCWLLYEFPIKRFNLIRPLFGLKMKCKKNGKLAVSPESMAYSSRGNN